MNEPVSHEPMSVPTERAASDVAQRVVDRMVQVDTLAQWMGVETVEVAPGRSVIRMTVRDDMLNGAGGVHGGAVYSLADSAFSYATNNSGIISVAIDCTMSYPAASKVGDTLTAVAVVESSSKRLAFCNVTVRTQNDVIVGHFRGTVYRTLKPHFPEADTTSTPSTTSPGTTIPSTTSRGTTIPVMNIKTETSAS